MLAAVVPVVVNVVVTKSVTVIVAMLLGPRLASEGCARRVCCKYYLPLQSLPEKKRTVRSKKIRV